MAKLIITKQTGDYWSFVLNGDTANEILNTRNDLLVLGNECHFKTANGANLVQRQDILPTDVTIIASQTYSPIDKHQLFNDLIAEGYFDWFRDGGTGGTGVDRFDELLDTFKYTGKNGMCVTVDETQLRLVATPFHNISKTTELLDMPKNIVGNQMLISNPTGTGYQFANIPSEPETFLNTIGYFIYEDLATQGAPISFTNGVKVLIPNDGNGDGTDTSEAPFGVGEVWITDTAEMNFSDLSIGDTVDLRIRVDVDATTNSQKYQIIIKTAIGSPSEEENVVFTVVTKSAGTDTNTFNFLLPIANSDIINYPSQLFFASDSNGTFKVFKFVFRVIRKNINIVQIGAQGLDLKEDKANKKGIVGNESSTLYYPTIKAVVDYIASKGAGTLDSVLGQGDTSSKQILLQKDIKNYLSLFHPTFRIDGIQSKLHFDSAGTFFELYQDIAPQLFDLTITNDTATENYVSAVSIRNNFAFLKSTYTNKQTGAIAEYTIMAIKDGFIIQKRTDRGTVKATIKLDNLDADYVYQLPLGNGTLALQSDITAIINGLTTDSVAEGINPARLYFSAARVLATLLAGLSTATGGNILATDSILIAFGKLQNQINSVFTGLGTTNTIVKFTSTGIGNSSITDDGTNITLLLKTIISRTANIGSTNGAVFDITGSITATGGIARTISSAYIETSLIAGNNGDTLIALDINTAFNNGSFTGVLNYAIRTSGSIVPRTNQGANLGSGALMFSTVYSNFLFANILRIGSPTSFSIVSSDALSIFFTVFNTSGNIVFQNAGTTPTDNGVDRVQIKGTAIATGWKVPNGLPSQFLKADGSIDSNAYALDTPVQIIITTTVNITASTKATDYPTLGQHGRNVIIDNGITAITYTIDSPITSSFMKLGNGTITFVQGAGRTMVQVDGTAIFNGIIGSTATITSIGTTDYLRISNA